MIKNKSKYTVALLDRSYNQQMLDILKSCPIKSGGFEICFDREPDVFKLAELKYNPAKYIGFFKDEKLVGFILMGYHQAYINGKTREVYHFTDFYVLEEARNKGFFYKASELVFKNAEVGYAIIMQGNNDALSHVSRRHKKFPYVPFSKTVGTLDVRNILVTFKKKESRKYEIRRATIKDIPTIIELLKTEYSNRLFGQYVDESTFKANLNKKPGLTIENYYLAEKDNKVVGVCAAWDTGSFKQTRVLKLSLNLRMTRFVYSVLAYLFGFPTLPDEGKCFKEVYLTDYAVKDRNSGIMRALLVRIYNEYRTKKNNSVIFGSSEDDPLLKATKGFFSQSVKSHIILSVADENMINETKVNLPYIDVAML
ncbi:hypothetical protein [Carboxylicivirga caseinilyticus]|uniref:hypothetical protein n=1 Tax=Carboxylicivirga caseinilyticus TaxID=3417572 RepID=UPI003D330B52|nr:GNAT family N-acetyltransferase [Marinilabiliaceae bacterium A049]